ncbi:MAG TPA: hypothetical protein DEA08_21415 [Planctomycetes bacterium]|nr:hypothetical protein [Planctomycetota bacterium]
MESGRSERWVERAWVHIHFLRVVLPQFRISLGVFLGVNLLGALVIWSEGPAPRTFWQALHTALALNFFEMVDPYPTGGGFLIQATYFLLPAIGLTVIAEGLVRLGVLIGNRKRLDPEWHMALASTFKDHVVIAGLGKVGLRVARRLQGDEHVVGIDRVEPSDKGEALSENVAVLLGDATSMALLEQANVARARAILVLTDNDLANLEIALNARELNPEIRVVLRMFNEQLGKRLVDEFGFDAVYSTTSLAAPSFSAALYSNRILQSIEVGPEKVVHMARVEVEAGSSLVGKTILEVEQERGVSIVLHHSAGRADLLPSIRAEVSAGDVLYLLAELRELERVDRAAEA